MLTKNEKLIAPQALVVPPDADIASFHIVTLVELVERTLAVTVLKAVGTGRVVEQGIRYWYVIVALAIV